MCARARAWECVYIWICVCVCVCAIESEGDYGCVCVYKYMLVRGDNQICWKVQCSAVLFAIERKNEKNAFGIFLCGIGFLASISRFLPHSLTLHLRPLFFYSSCNLLYTLFYWQHIASYLNLHSTNDRLSKHKKECCCWTLEKEGKKVDKAKDSIWKAKLAIIIKTFDRKKTESNRWVWL